MGTRALISKNGQLFIATQSDGYPSSLGADLLKAGANTLAIIRAADSHTIVFANKSLLSVLNKERYKKIAALTNGKYSADDIAKMHKKGEELNFTVMRAGDSYVDDIANYGDWAEYQYDLKGGKWFFRPLSGAWDASPLNRKGAFKPLTPAAVKA